MPGRKPVVVVYSPKEYAAWQKDAGAALGAVASPYFFEGPVLVELLVELPRPKTTKLTAPKPDVDNFAKSVLDAITKDGRFWSDDTQVVTLYITKAWGLEGRIQVTIKEL